MHSLIVSDLNHEISREIYFIAKLILFRAASILILSYKDIYVVSWKWKVFEESSMLELSNCRLEFFAFTSNLVQA